MKTLMLLRHAKSSWESAGLDDIDRPLSERGRRAAVRVGQELVRREWLPDQAILSPAERCCQTWELAAGAWHQEVPARPMAELYLASSARLLEVLRGVPAGVERLLLLGHNPGLEQLAARLSGPGSDVRARDRLVSKFPTAALTLLEFPDDWSDLSWSAARLTHCLRPKDLD